MLTNTMIVKPINIKLIICFLLLSGNTLAQEEELSAPLIFGVNTSPPFHITQGDEANNGFCDVLVKTIQAELPNTQQIIQIDRVDYTIDYEMMIPSYERNKEDFENDESLAFIPITEYEGKRIRGAIGCSNNEWGKNATRLIDRVITDIRNNNDFQQSLDYWLGNDRPKLSESEQ
ncbi:hypothetical protein [Idiomarina aminovorans]|uniref:hypothetical protein n=1 Tax=Idiomarina aminovorans TaxID=2914829 RepID=UPI002006D122|nr:hypothetical protein [Idiomarina sp. ATCH4]MCK7458671.1 hypothetical protein [Idiomarina sp. ATCH4]